MRKLIILIFVVIFQIFASYVHAQDIQKEFSIWLETDLRPLAKTKGISEATFNSALGNLMLNLKLPDLTRGSNKKIPQQQAEFSTPSRYFDETSIASLVKEGKAIAVHHAALLAQIEQKYGVPASIILAIWGRETNFGNNQGQYSAFQVLATKAFISNRKELFLSETLAALEMVEKGYALPSMMRSSWAGAMGNPQFLPSSYLNYAVDFDGDGRRDIWNSTPDALASIANYLNNYGWKSGLKWGDEVSVPKTVSCALEGFDLGKPLETWLDLGVKGIQTHLGQNEYFLMNPAGRLGPMFLVSENFYVIKNYNISDLYALFIAHIADRINGYSGGFKASWAKIDAMHKSDVANMQIILNSKGLDVGKMDGIAGFKTRRSIGEWQAKIGQPVTCFPSTKLLRRLK
jgi:lytic murein transglycosylase